MTKESIMFTDPNYHQGKYRMLVGHMIVIEGIIGVGKSTLGQSLERFLQSIGIKAKFFPEFMSKPLLDQYIEKMEKYAYPFQIIMLRERIHIYHQAHQFSLSGGISIIDRSVFGDYTFAKMQYQNGLISDDEFKIYSQILRDEKLIEPNIIVYLDVSPAVAFKRMLNRGIKSEKEGYTIDYFTKLHQCYYSTIEQVKCPIIKVDWSKDIQCQEDEQCLFILDQIKNRL